MSYANKYYPDYFFYGTFTGNSFEFHYHYYRESKHLLMKNNSKNYN